MEKCKRLILLSGVLLWLFSSVATAATTPKDDELYAMILDLQATIATQQATIDTLTTRLATVEASSVMAMAPFITFDDAEPINEVVGPNIIFEGVNIHLRSGSGTTEGPVNGVGNLIIGYNEMPDRDPFIDGDRGGSHNLVMGKENRFASYVGLVHGENNAVMDENSATIAGHGHKVPGGYAAAIGGHYNTVTGTEAVAIGGGFNYSSGKLSVVSGGEYNYTDGRVSTVSGGSNL